MLNSYKSPDTSDSGSTDKESQPLLKSQEYRRNENQEDFDSLLEKCGSEGRYQKIFLYLIMLPIAVGDPFVNMNMFFMLYVPDHWCHVNGQGNHTTEFWKNLTIPMEEGPNGEPRYSQCKMYGENYTETTCQFGWDYDRTYYTSTIPTDFNWVCSQADYATRAFTFSNIGNAVGSIILGHASDRIGRKPIIFFCLLITLVFGGTALFVPQYYTLYLALQFLSGLAFPSLITAICLIGSETCSQSYRAWVFSLSCFFRVIGNTIFPLIASVLATWFSIGVISYAPAVLMLVSMWKFLPESPRWLMSVGRMEEAHSILVRIAQVNRRDITSFEIITELEKIKKGMEIKQCEMENSVRMFGAWTLFSKARLAKHTVLLCSTWAIIGLIFYGLNLSTLNMSGNPFINHIVLIGIVDLPSGWVLGILVEKTGRRWTLVFLLIFSAITCSLSAFLVSGTSGTGLDVLICGLITKFFIVIADLITDLQGSELFPTQLRSTGFSLASTTSAFMQIIGPYTIFMGKSFAAGPYIILSGLSLIGAFLASLIPETTRLNLPESIKEANNLGKHDKFWSFLPKR